MGSANYIYSLTTVAAFLRCEKVAPNLTEALLKNLSLTFRTDSDISRVNDGEYLYRVFSSDSNLKSVKGFSNQQWDILENLIEGNQQSKIGISSLIYCFSVYTNIDGKYKKYYINKLCNIIYKNKPPKTFELSEIENLISSLDISVINSEIKQSEIKQEYRTVNYNYYDALPLFANLESDLRLKQAVKDSENQYYYVSGKVSYEPNINLNECEKNEIVVSTPTGDIITTVYRNFPCVEKDSFVGPVSGVEFVRFFNDGPPSSGYFESDTLEAYIKFDENISNLRDYSSNNRTLYSFVKNLSGNYIFLKSGVQIDTQGAFSSTGEYGNERTNWITDVEGCRWTKEELETLPLMRMHQGDNLPKYNYYKIKISQTQCETGINGPLNWTGFKFVNFKLNDSWSNYFNFIKTNPRDEDDSRILKRALNIENFYDSNTSTIHSPYLNVSSNENGVLICNDYVSYPQINANSSLPGFAFYQTFDNKNFGTGNSEEFSSIFIHPAISSGLSSNIDSKSNRNFKVSDFPVFSGKKLLHENKSKIPISITFGSDSIGNYDDVFKKAITIGDNFNNEISGNSSLQLNAGYLYTGYKLFKDGELVNLSSLLEEYEDKKIAAEYSKVKFITGYLDTGTNTIYPIVPLTAHIQSGNIKEVTKPGEYIVYYYFNTNTGEGSIYSVNTGWTGNFAPIPTGVINNPKYSGLFGYQKVENYFPRYWSGPYATYENKFLYPNAKYIYEKYNSFQNGFPYKISYKINVREETVRELFLNSGFNSFAYEKIVRAGPGGTLSGLEATMISPFYPNTSNQQIKNKYDFYKNKNLYIFPDTMDSFGFFYYASLDKQYVNAFYVNDHNYWLNNNLNSETYRYTDTSNFVNGIRIKKQPITKKIKVNKNNQIVDFTGVFFAPSTAGLYWGYKGTKITGEMLYCPPLFDLSLLRKNVTEDLKKKFLFPIVEDQNVNNIKDQDDIEDSPIFSNNGLVDDAFFNPYEGIDPIFGEYVGGRIGDGAELEGGYHSKNIIGDSWYNFHKEFVGKKQIGFNQYVRNAINDLNFFLLSVDSGNLNIYTRSLSYYPFYHNLNYKPFVNSTLNNIGVNVTPLKVQNGDYYFNFDLQSVFPLKDITNTNGEFYSSSGLKIGPFDRDIELCVLKGNSILSSGNIVIDNTFIAGSQIPTNYKNKNFNSVSYINVNNYLNLFPLSSGIIPGSGGRNENVTTFKLIPSGKIVEINISGTGAGKLGFGKEAVVTIRPRTFYKDIKVGPNDINGLSSHLLSGDPCYLNVYNFVNNDTEQKMSLSHEGDFKKLVGKKIEYTTAPRIEFLFPVPSNDFEQILASKNLISRDSLNNKIYQGTKGPTYDYWKIKNPNLQITGIRESTRISIEIESIDLEYGHSPYQSQKIIIPSGFCKISGIFAYTGQAESSILSQGLFLTGVARPSVLDSYYNPHYISDVLKRLPIKIQQLPSGSGKFPVLEAPSYTKKRKNYFDLDLAKSEYENYSPPGYNYNKFIWPALSDLAELNPEIVYERLPPEDDNTFTSSYLFFSASKGQVFFETGSGSQNPIENATYKTQYLYAFIDSTATNSSYNTGKCIIKVNGEIDTLNTGNLSGILAIENTTISLNSKL